MNEALAYADTAHIAGNEDLRSIAFLFDVRFHDLWFAYWIR